MEIAELLDKLDEDRIAEIADACAFLDDHPDNDITDYRPDWDVADDDGPWSPDDRWTVAA